MEHGKSEQADVNTEGWRSRLGKDKESLKKHSPLAIFDDSNRVILPAPKRNIDAREGYINKNKSFIVKVFICLSLWVF